MPGGRIACGAVPRLDDARLPGVVELIAIELAVMMVTDLVGSTALGSELGPARFERYRQEHDSIVRDAAEDAGGRVVKHTGDGLVFAFGSVSAALTGGVGVQQKLEHRNRSAEIAMTVRIGVSIGDAVVEDGDYFGTPLMEATRLCQRAGGGELLIADPVRALVRDRAILQLQPVGALRLRGLPEPLIAWRVAWKPLPETSGPRLPARLRGRPDTAYVGRCAERRALEESWGRALAGHRQVVVISGEPGIGKTRLVAQTAATALPDDAVILYGRCDEDQGLPYFAWREVLCDYAQIAPRRLLRPHAQELSRLVPGLGEKLGTVAAPVACDPETERYRLFNAVASLLAAAAEVAPVLVILDDLHWADRPTLILLKHVITAPSTGRLMLLATFRDSDIGAQDPLRALLADLHREPGAARLSLTGLGEAAIVDLIQEMAGHPVDSSGFALAREVHRETAGNPFFVGEMLRHLRETGAIARQADGHWSFSRSGGASGLPQSVREVVGRRLARLGADARHVLGVGAVIGAEFDPALAAVAADLPVARVLDLLDEAIAASLVIRSPIAPASFLAGGCSEGYAFSHGLVQTTLYEALPTGRRAALHQAVGHAIEAGGGADGEGRLAEIAHHYLAGALAGNGELAVDYASRAGAQAMRQFAYDQAAVLYERALAVPGLDRGPPRIALLQALGDARMRAGDCEAARLSLLEAAEAARRHGDPEALARATRACGIWGLSFGVDDVLVGLAEESLELLEGCDRPRLIAEIKGLLAAALYYAPVAQAQRRERLAAEALATARDVHAAAASRESAHTLAYVIGRYLLARWGPQSAVRDFGLADELLGLCRELGDVELELLARNWRGTIFLERGDLTALAHEVARIEQMATDLRQPRAMVFLPLHRGMLSVTAGRFAEAERLNQESVEIGERMPGSVGRLAAYTQMVLIRMHQGRLPELEERVRAMVDAYPDMVGIRCSLVVLLLQAGRDGQARAEFEHVLAGGPEALVCDHTHILMLALLAEAAVALDDRPRARTLYQWLEPYSGRWAVSASTFALWPVDRSLGQLAGAAGSVQLGLSHLDRARRQGERADALPSLALIALDEARLLARRAAGGDGQRAARRAGEARVLADHLGMRHVSAGAARLQDDLGEGRRDTAEGVVADRTAGAVGTVDHDETGHKQPAAGY